MKSISLHDLELIVFPGSLAYALEERDVGEQSRIRPADKVDVK